MTLAPSLYHCQLFCTVIYLHYPSFSLIILVYQRLCTEVYVGSDENIGTRSNCKSRGPQPHPVVHLKETVPWHDVYELSAMHVRKFVPQANN
jgi:hypothetical protein